MSAYTSKEGFIGPRRPCGKPLTYDGLIARMLFPDMAERQRMKRVQRAGGAERILRASPMARKLILPGAKWENLAGQTESA